MQKKKSAPKTAPKKIAANTPFQAFRKLYLSEIPDEDLSEIQPSSIEHLIKRHFELSESKGNSRFLIEIGNPDQKNWGWESQNTVLSIIFDDMSFVIDSVTALLTEYKFNIKNTVHPLINVKRNAKGNIEDVSEDYKDGFSAEGYLFIELTRRLTPAQIKTFQSELQIILEDVRLATKDWQPIKAKVKEAQTGLKTAPGLYFDDLQEYVEFVNYIHDDNFTLLGYKYYKATKKNGKVVFTPDNASGLGLLSPSRKTSFLNGEEKAFLNTNKLADELPAVFVSKIAIKSPVHRRVPVDAVLIRQHDKSGNVIGEVLLLGLFTSVTYSRSIKGIPFLRHKGAKVIAMTGFDSNSHDQRAIRHIIEKFPRDELFQTDIEDVYKTSMSILRLQERPRIVLFLREDPFGRTVSALVYIPRDRWDTRLRLKFQKILEEELEADCTNYYSTVDDSALVRIIYSMQWQHGQKIEYDASFIEARLQEAGRSWDGMLFQTLMEKYQDHDSAAAVSLKYNASFPVSYQEKYQPRQARHDIAKIESVLETGDIELELFKPNTANPRQMSLKIFSPDTTLPLSDILPILENFGLKSIAEYPFEIKVANKSVWIQDLVIEIPASMETLDVTTIKDSFESCLKEIWVGTIEDDSLNKLIILSGLPHRDIVILRSYVRYLRQTSLPFSLQYVEQALTDYPVIAKLLVNLFHAHFDPSAKTKGAALVPGILAAIEQNLQLVKALDQDRILRSATSLIECTLRTNFFQHKAWISLKFDSAKVPELPDPRPYREIFVYSPRVEGVHLRADKISRGGLRWSDRAEDFRTEVLGLLKAQQVKNAIIIPMGAKGGFVVKRPPSDRAAFMVEGKECYRIFIRGLLDITDNQKAGKVIPPENVVRRDEDDTYLVVAADKGTATFSDIANSLSIEYSFWLGDAFASGGSSGYDHKAMGITARGSWESVKRHFRELGHDVQTKPFEVVGVGDMGGDVFGNGMLNSKATKLIGAFNHLHIFCDPTPNPAESYKERLRLFKDVKGWDHYNQKLLSKGARIYNRSDKSLKLTPEIQKRFDLTKSDVSPNELMTAMLKARTDLLYFGGIGTYIKSSKETHQDAGDRSNDIIRINGRDVRALVIGEGANLGMTQRGRVEYAEQGGHLNTDFIDNSAGVDTSDHEVNIKILFADIMAQKGSTMNVKSRDKLLVSMTDEVQHLVLSDNYQQTQALSLITAHAVENLGQHAELMTLLERDGFLRREIEFLPDEEAIEKRREAGKGLTRPELCVLFSYSKISYTKALIETSLPDDKAMLDWAIHYFPKALQKKFEKEIKNHRLKRNIIATMIANAVINRMGPSFIRLTMEKTGKDVETITRAVLDVRKAFGLNDIYDSIEALDLKVDANIQLKAIKELGVFTDHEVRRVLSKDKTKVKPTSISAHQNTQNWKKDGLPEALAKKIANLTALYTAE